MLSKTTAAALAAAALLALAACSPAAPDLVGNWKASDGSPMKVVAKDGRCSGMYYSNGKPLDIGGGMTCSVSSKKDSAGRYSLVVSQPPNQATYSVAFDGDSKATVYAGSVALYTMTRQ